MFFVKIFLMKLTLLFLLILTPIALIAQEDDSGFTSYWDKGYHLDSNDGNFKLKFGGRIQYDEAVFFQDAQNENAFGDLDNASALRRVRFVNSGTLYKFLDYKLEFDFASGDAIVTDAFITLKNLPVVGNIRIGHQKEPFSLDQMNSSNDMTFMERAPLVAFKKQRNSGLLIFNTALEQRATWAIGFYHNSDANGKSLPDDKYNVTGRITGLPFYKKEENKLLHLGFAYSRRNPSERNYNISSKPASNLAPTFVATGPIENVSKNYTIGTELALIWDNFALQGEYIASGLEDDVNTYNFNGYYGEVSYFLTGEHKNYSTKDAWFKRVTPNKNFNPVGENKGWGAFEAAVRYSSLDLNDETVNGGELRNITAALNWYVNPAARFSVNYVHAMVNNLGDTDIVQFRFQVAF